MVDPSHAKVLDKSRMDFVGKNPNYFKNKNNIGDSPGEFIFILHQWLIFLLVLLVVFILITLRKATKGKKR